MAINIYVDQGHNPGTINAGASGNGIIESEVTYWVGIYLAGFLYADPRFGVRVSRPFPDTVVGEDTSSSLRTRVEAANLWPADYFISIRVNSNPSPALNGSEVYVYRANSAAADLAAEVLASIVELVGTRYNMVRLNPSLYVLRATVMPAILVELGYLTNLSDAEKLKNDQYLFAFAIYIGILNYFGFSYDDFPNR
ncbi:N-acetylmuramoyl-L-alanine amidase family protein [Dielma fastidiosa]|uniref:N-acetylmuramoyl-L-alanine amidase family protein n=1 Tax=Dielma fastidiosa TaxID=1034346 RepID=UPI000E5395AC|nr:N-acetylmuramoyl-L-alanine amidase [Dielma fastidiosa]RHN03302.1 N-acetylmuramoyl-L-alanine amidase [Dielma fastidiosa]